MKDIDFDKVKYPEFIRKIHFPLTNKYDGENLTVKAEMKASAITVARIDNMLVDRISEIAKEHGITDLYILDKQNIVTALQKQIPKKPEIKIAGTTGWNTTTYCPACKGEVLKARYCVHCGQALDWGQEDDR